MAGVLGRFMQIGEHRAISVRQVAVFCHRDEDTSDDTSWGLSVT